MSYKEGVIELGFPLIASFLCVMIIVALSHIIWLNGVYMDANDPNNPGRYGGLIITNEVKEIADSLVDPSDTPHEKVLKDMRWVNEKIEFKSPPPRMAHPNVIIYSGVGLCGDYAIVTTALLACQGVESRIVGLYNCNPDIDAHVIIEVYYNDSWHMYGPTMVSYWENDGRVLSFDDLRNGGSRNATPHYETNTNFDTLLLTPELYESANPAGELGPEHPMWWPLTIDREFIVPPIGYYSAGSRHIGAFYTNNCQNWSITNLTPGKEYLFVIYPKYMWGNDTFVLRINNSTYTVKKPNVIVADPTSGDVDMPPIYINFTSLNTTHNLYICNDYRGPKHVVMTVEKYVVV